MAEGGKGGEGGEGARATGTNQNEPTFTPLKEEIIWNVLKASIKGLTENRRDGSNGDDWIDRLGEEEPDKQWKWKTQDFYKD
ncbi:hypothetical protein BGZ80_001306 [Entomortierella chlamydospora]|uniref:Uncharacterized protein n=1 Tax=Entomortierella chlamydospora TaxID=101097 RepID=A0A9P6MRU5_9FUNG|nr:hypothetical protein BGZ80_001306 [Entomortierella chlamydospora]